MYIHGTSNGSRCKEMYVHGNTATGSRCKEMYVQGNTGSRCKDMYVQGYTGSRCKMYVQGNTGSRCKKMYVQGNTGFSLQGDVRTGQHWFSLKDTATPSCFKELYRARGKNSSHLKELYEA